MYNEFLCGGMVIKEGDKVKISYTLTVDGEIIDSTEGQDPIEYQHGKNQIIPGLERQLESLGVGEEREIVVGPEDGYGIIDPKGFIEVAKSRLPEGDIEEGMPLQVTESDGQIFYVRVDKINEETVVLNFNHPLAGKQLFFNVRIISIDETS
jgi:FKBP-type peptidyl-prolyl cis-trans isomerase SlyD